MRVYKVVLVVAMLVFAGNVMGMGKSDGTKEEVKSSLSKESAAPAKVEPKACPTTAKDASLKACDDAKAAKTCPLGAKEAISCPTDAKKACCPVAAKAKAEVKAVDELIVTVNGIKITQATIDKKIKPRMDAQIKQMKK